MRLCKVHFENLPGSPYSQSAMHETEMLDRESHNDYDARTWLEKCTVDANGQINVPALGMKQCMDTGAYKLGEKVPGRRGILYKGFFTSGVICLHDVPIFADGKPLTKKDAVRRRIWANATGERGSGKRVRRLYPEFPKYQGIAEFLITDDIITEDVFERTARASGLFVGIGRFRAENGGTYGRFRVTKFEWEKPAP